jgi:signal transduction histidine kinase
MTQNSDAQPRLSQPTVVQGPVLQGPAAQVPLINSLLLSNFVHQIINPLNGVVGTVDNLIDDTIHADRQKDRLKAVRAQLKQSIEMIRNLAFLAELEGSGDGKPGIKDVAQAVRIPKIIIEAAQFFQESASVRRIEIRLTDFNTQFIVPGHADLLRQVFSNIFDNGVKYGDDDSVIEVTPWAQKRTGHLLIEIRGRGRKFSHDEKERIFELGYRGEEAKQARASGAGIGLYLCRRILEVAHSATIEAEVAGVDETIFRMRFPAYEVDETPFEVKLRTEETKARRPGKGGRKRRSRK